MRAVAEPALSEDALVAAIAQAIGESARPLRLGIGDDAAAWQPRRSHLALLTTDMLVEGVHFRLDDTDAASLGHKALAQNLSDIAAMGGAPVLAVVAMGVTPALDEAWIREFYGGMATLARTARCAIAGGDIVRTPAAILGVTVAGEVRPTRMRTRAGARPGDALCVTGPLGLSRLGLELVGNERASRAAVAPASACIDAYLRPAPRLREGAFLGTRADVHAMMDVSDGLSTDGRRMCVASGVDAVIDAAALAPAAAFAALAQSLGVDPIDAQLNGGDDYELLVAIGARALPHVARTFQHRCGRPLRRIGRFEQGTGQLWIEESGTRRPLAPHGYDHLTSAR